MTPLAVIGSTAGVVATLAIGAYTGGYRLNMTPSLPPGLWHVTDAAPARGAVVFICPPDNQIFQGARRAGYLRLGVCPGGYAPLLKPAMALPGDVVQVTAGGVVVNGRLIANTRPLARDGKGRVLPRLPGDVTRVAAGQVWLLSSYHAGSFDSRYYGPLASNAIQGVAHPVLVFGRAL